MRSLLSRVAFNNVESAFTHPDSTRKIDSLPANGSIMVLNTNADAGAAGSGLRSISSPVFGLAPRTAPASTGDARQSTIASSSA